MYKQRAAGGTLIPQPPLPLPNVRIRAQAAPAESSDAREGVTEEGTRL
jgi:hypothetical protein